MPRFYFDLKDGAESVIDSDGDNLLNVEEARREACVLVGERMSEAMPDGDHRAIEVNVRDESGRRVLRATMALNVEMNLN